MNSNSTLLVLLAVGAVLAVLLLFGSAPDTTDTTGASASTPTPSRPLASETPVVATSAATVPVVDAGPDRTVNEREDVRLSGSGYDPAGGRVITYWSAENGLGYFEDPYDPNTIYTAPSACNCEDKITLVLTVTNASGVSVSDRVCLSIRDPLECPAPIYGTSGSFVVMPTSDACVVERPTCPAVPSQACESPCITEAPIADGCLEVPAPCACGSSDGCGEVFETAWPFGPEADHPRDYAKARIARQFPERMTEERATPLLGIVENPACLSVCFDWSVSKGWLEHADTLQPIYHAPASHRVGGETVTIKLTVYDGHGNRSFDQIRIQIDNVTGPGSSG